MTGSSAPRPSVHEQRSSSSSTLRRGGSGIFGTGIDALAQRLAYHGVAVGWDENFPGHRRFYTHDPLGNRLEFLEPVRASSPAHLCLTAAGGRTRATGNAETSVPYQAGSRTVSSVPDPTRFQLTDGVIVLRPPTTNDIDAILAGEDEQMALWLNDGPSTRASVATHITHAQAGWRAGGPKLALTVRAADTDELVGTVEAHTAAAGLHPGQVNISYGLYPAGRGHGYATRAVRLLCSYLATSGAATVAVIRAHPGNPASAAVARRCGFQPARASTPDGHDWYALSLTTATDRRPLQM
jgi:RimJ/RimL family protein N-acetyltransferase